MTCTHDRTLLCWGCGENRREVHPYALAGRESVYATCGRMLCPRCIRLVARNSIYRQRSQEHRALQSAHHLLKLREYKTERERAEAAELEAQRDAVVLELHTNTKKRKISKRLRYEILRRDEFKCQGCGRTAEHHSVTLHVDHQQPFSKGGTSDDENLWTLCSDCNLGKGASLS